MGFVVLVLIAIIAVMVISALSKSNRRVQYADTQQGLRALSAGEGRMPSWAANDSKSHEFRYIVGKLAVHNGVPKDVAGQALSNPTVALLALVQLAGAMEANGASFNGQKMAAAETFARMWTTSSPEKRATLLQPVDAQRG